MKTTMFDHNRFGRALRQARTEQQLTYKEAAEHSGVSAAVLHRIETEHHTPTIDVFVKLLDWLGKPVTEYIYDPSTIYTGDEP